jgi:hypothetical protein
VKKLLPLLFLLFFFFEVCEGQAPLVYQWDKRYGGYNNEMLYVIQQTQDEGFVLGGITWSDSSYEVSQHTRGNYDYWIVKTNNVGVKLWDKRFGGAVGEQLHAIQQTADGGYLLGGTTYSDSSGDVTERTRDTTTGQNYKGDYWIIKIDSIGIKQWDKRFGGYREDWLYSVQQTNDGGYILGGFSWSDSSGDVSQHSKGGPDYWIVKIDSLGNKQWDRRYGGSLADEMGFVEETFDGGYIVGGFSDSDSSGDISHHNHGGRDYWIIKIDSGGNKEWDNGYGGYGSSTLLCMHQTSDRGFILGGITNVDSAGDVSQHSRGRNDFWIIKVDSLGNKQWNKLFGGNLDEDEFGNVIETFDKGYLIGGTSYSPASGDKSENNWGFEQTWVIKTDSLGNKQWDKTIKTNLGSNDDEQGLVLQTKDGCYVFGNSTWAPVGGDVTQFQRGLGDFWIVKFCDTTLTSVNPLSTVNFQFSIYPNPFTNELVIKSQESSSREIILFDVAGKEILRQKTTEAETRLNTEGIAAGFYLLRVGGENFKVVKAQ